MVNTSFFDALLAERGLKECLRPLWKLKITDDEFNELRELLKERTRITCENPFMAVRRESALFFAEYWRRLYAGSGRRGGHSKSMVYGALESGSGKDDLVEKFYKAALCGAKELKIERYNGGPRQTPLDDMLYQGGLPMKLITAQSQADGNPWNRFARGLVNKKIDFTELVNNKLLGKVAQESKSLQEFCRQLMAGIEGDGECEKMPFYCKDKFNEWFVSLMDLAKKERRRHRESHPYSLSWMFDIDTIEHKISTKYKIEGAGNLSSQFLKDNNLDGVTFFSVQVRENGRVVDTFDYRKNFCRYNVLSFHEYRDGDIVSLYLHDEKEPYLSDSLDMSTPHLLYRNEAGKYELGNKIGQAESLILMPQGWNVCNNDYNLNVSEYSWCEQTLSGIIIPCDFQNTIDVQGPNDENVSFGSKIRLYWTEIKSSPIYVPNVVEPLYNAAECSFLLCSDAYDDTDEKHTDEKRPKKAGFRSKWQREWLGQPAYGEIYAAAICEGKFVTPVRLINIGDGLVVEVKGADKDSCRIKVEWKHGTVSTNEGMQDSEGVWRIEKSKLQDLRKIRFTFTPRGNNYNSFSLHIYSPFKEFSIVDYAENDIAKHECLIPYDDIDRYRYHLVGQTVKYQYGNERRTLVWNDDEKQLSIVDRQNGGDRRQIPFEGSLTTLFGSRETVASLLERTSKNILHAELKVEFRSHDDRLLKSITIKNSPFVPKQKENGCVVIEGNDNFKEKLRLFRLDDPTTKLVEMSYDSATGCYHLPEDIRPWGKTLLTGQTIGRIRPICVDLTQTMDDLERKNNRSTTSKSIEDSLRNATMGDKTWTIAMEWFKLVQENGIPASSILQLSCIAHDKDWLLRFVFQLYMLYMQSYNTDVLEKKLMSFSGDLAFQWYWLKPDIDTMLYRWSNNGFINPDSDIIKKMYMLWACRQDEENRNLYLSALGDTEKYYSYFVKCFDEFNCWLKKLCVSSMTESYDDIDNTTTGIINDIANDIINDDPKRIDKEDKKAYVYNNQGDVANEFFYQYTEQGGNLSSNEQWLYQRVNAVVAHIRRKIDLFSMSEEIRRSIIYCSKSSTQYFVIALNNKLIKK